MSRPDTTTRKGKIARLPFELRNEVNERLRNGEAGPRLLKWLNGLPAVRSVLDAEFGGERVKEQNLSDWRKGGYGDWLAKKERAEERREQIDWALKATGGDAADAVSLMTASQFVDILSDFDPRLVKELIKDDPSQYAEVLKAFAAMERGRAQRIVASQGDRKLEQNDEKLEIERQVLKLRQLATAEKFLAFYKDERAKTIVEGDGDNSAKLEALGSLMFGEHWK